MDRSFWFSWPAKENRLEGSMPKPAKDMSTICDMPEGADSEGDIEIEFVAARADEMSCEAATARPRARDLRATGISARVRVQVQVPVESESIRDAIPEGGTLSE